MTPPTHKYIGKRAAATLIDYSIVFSFTIFYFYMAGKSDGQGKYTVSGWPVLGFPGFWFIYIVALENLLGGTLGHMAMKLKVVSQNGLNISFGQTLKRRLCDVLEISWCFGLVAYLLAANTRSNQRLGDILAKTFVIGSHELYTDIQFDFEKITHV